MMRCNNNAFNFISLHTFNLVGLLSCPQVTSIGRIILKRKISHSSFLWIECMTALHFKKEQQSLLSSLNFKINCYICVISQGTKFGGLALSSYLRYYYLTLCFLLICMYLSPFLIHSFSSVYMSCITTPSNISQVMIILVVRKL